VTSELESLDRALIQRRSRLGVAREEEDLLHSCSMAQVIAAERRRGSVSIIRCQDSA
jgi:hypothetical protein